MKNLSPKEAITILEGMRIDIPVPKAAVTQIKRNSALDMAINALELFGNSEQLPSAQPEPRTAYWTKDIVGSVVCSNCGGIREDNRIGHTQWCNCCGCFMRGE